MKKIWYLSLLFLLNEEIVSWLVLTILMCAFLYWLINGVIEEKEKK